MKKKLAILTVLLLFISTSFFLPTKEVQAYSGFRIKAVSSAHKLYSWDPLDMFESYTDYQENDHQPITVTTQYPCIYTVVDNCYIFEHVWIDGSFVGNLDENIKNVIEENASQNEYTHSEQLVLPNLTPGKHEISIIATQVNAGQCKGRDYVDIIVPATTAK